jgi:hypothetical protein
MTIRRWWLAVCLVLAIVFAGKAFWGMSARPPAAGVNALGTGVWIRPVYLVNLFRDERQAN